MTLQERVVQEIGREKLEAYRQGLLWYVFASRSNKGDGALQYGICYALNSRPHEEGDCAYEIWYTLLKMGVPCAKVLDEWRHMRTANGKSANGEWYVRTECARQLADWVEDALAR